MEAAHARLAAEVVEILVERDLAVLGLHVGAHRVIAHRQDARGDAEAATEAERYLGQPPVRGEALGAQEGRGEGLVAELPPVGSAQHAEHALHRAHLAFHFPAGARRRDAGQRIEHGVEVRREGEPQVLVVVAGVDDDREVLAAQAVQTLGEPGAPDLPGQCDDCPHGG